MRFFKVGLGFLVIGFVLVSVRPIFGLTLAECLDIANQLNPDLMVQRQVVLRAKAQVSLNRADGFPNVSIGANVSQRLSDIPYPGVTYGVSLTQKLFPFLVSSPEVSRAEAVLNSEKSTLQLVSSQVRFDVTSAYVALVFAEKNLELAKSISARRKENASLVKARFEAGREHKGSYLRAKAQYSQAKLDVDVANRAMQIAQLGLLQSMGKSLEDSVQVSEEIATPTLVLKDVEALTQQSPVVTKAKALVQVATTALQIAKNKYGLQVSLGLNANRSSDFTNGISSDTSNGMLMLSYPLLVGGKNDAEIASAEFDLFSSNWSFQSVLLSQKVAIQAAMVSAQNSLDSAVVQDEFVRSALVRSEISQAQYTSGLLTYDSWDIIESDRISQQKTMLSKKQSALLDCARYEQTIGKGLEE